MEHDNTSNGAPARLAIEGEFTIYTVAQWKPRLLEQIDGGAALELDMSGVSEIDAAGQQLLLAAQLHARALGGSVRVSACSKAVTDLLALCWLAGRFGLPTADRLGSAA